MPWAWEQPACRCSSFFFLTVFLHKFGATDQHDWSVRSYLPTLRPCAACRTKRFPTAVPFVPEDVRAGKLTFSGKSHILPSGRLPAPERNSHGCKARSRKSGVCTCAIVRAEIARRKKKKKKDVWWKRVHVEELRMADDYVAFCARCRFLRRKACLQNTFIVFLGRMILCSSVRPAPQRPRCPVCHNRPDCIAKVIERWINSQAISTSAVAASAYRSLAYPT